MVPSENWTDTVEQDVMQCTFLDDIYEKRDVARIMKQTINAFLQTRRTRLEGAATPPALGGYLLAHFFRFHGNSQYSQGEWTQL
jgi:hypothetical protein